MKAFINNLFCMYSWYALTLFITTGSIYGMKRPIKESTESILSVTEQKPPRIEKWKNIWIKTSDNQIITMPEWQIDQVKVLQMLLINQKGTNSKESPIDISELKKNNGSVVNTSTKTLNLIKTALELSGKQADLSIFVNSITKDEDTTLINSSFDLEANALSAALTSAILPSNIEQKINGHLLSPIITYCIAQSEFQLNYDPQDPNRNPLHPQIKISSNGKFILKSDQRLDINKTMLLNFNTNHITTINNSIENLKFSPTGKYIIGHFNTDYVLFPTQYPNPIGTIITRNSSCIALSPNDIYCLFNDLNIPGVINKKQNNNSGWSNPIALQNGHKALVNTIKFSPDGNYIVSGSNDKAPKNLILWNGKTLGKIANLTHKGFPSGHLSSVIQADFTPDSKYIISKDTENKVIVWDVSTKKPISMFTQFNTLWDAATQEYTLMPQHTTFTYQPKMLHHYIETARNTKTLYEFTVNSFFNHPILSVNPNALTKLLSHSGKISAEKYSSTPPFAFETSINIAENKDYNLEYAVESSDFQYLLLAYKPGYITLRQLSTGDFLDIPIQPFSSVQFSPSNDYIIALYPPESNTIYSLWSIDNSFKPILEMSNTTFTLSQARFLYRLYLAQINKVKVVIDQNDPDYEVYQSLPENIKTLVNRFLPFNLASDIAQKALKEFRQ